MGTLILNRNVYGQVDMEVHKKKLIIFNHSHVLVYKHGPLMYHLPTIENSELDECDIKTIQHLNLEIHKEELVEVSDIISYFKKLENVNNKLKATVIKK